MTEDEMVGWHHCLDGHEFKQALGDGDGQGSPAVHGIAKSRIRLSYWTELKRTMVYKSAHQQEKPYITKIFI